MPKIQKLMTHEKLLIWRHRRGISQYEAAALYNLPVKEYRNWEKGRRSYRDSTLRVKNLTRAEECLILRRRRGIRQEDLAKQSGYNRVWINRMETGRANATPLREFWNGGKTKD